MRDTTIGNNGTLKAEVYRLLRYGKENAKTGELLARNLDSNYRSIRMAIRELIRDKVRVAALVDPPFGYFIATTAEEVDEYLRVLRSRLVQDAFRRRDFKLASRVILDPHQMTLL